MPVKKRDLLDYRVAQVVEIVTRKSTEEPEASPALRHYAKFLGTGERNLYKLTSRALSAGFRFGVSVNYQRLGMYRVIAIADELPDLPIPVRATSRTIDVKRVLDTYVPGQCLGKVLEALESAGARVHLVGAEWGSRPALATIPFLSMKPDATITPEMEERMSSLLREMLARGPPPTITGRKYPLDKTLLAIIAEANEKALAESIARIAKDLGIHHAKAQRKYYNLWHRRVILGYRVRCAPYCSKSHVLAEVTYSDPMRMAYAVAVLPSVLSAMVTVDPARKKPEKVLVRLTGEGDMISKAISLLRQHWARVDNLVYLYEERINEDYAKQVLETPGADFPC